MTTTSTSKSILLGNKMMTQYLKEHGYNHETLPTPLELPNFCFRYNAMPAWFITRKRIVHRLFVPKPSNSMFERLSDIIFSKDLALSRCLFMPWARGIGCTFLDFTAVRRNPWVVEILYSWCLSIVGETRRKGCKSPPASAIMNVWGYSTGSLK